MDAKLVVQQAINKGVHLYVTDSKLKFRAAQGTMTPDLMALVKQFKVDIITLLGNVEEIEIAAERPPIVATGKSSALLSFSQQRLWFIDQLEGGSAQYNMPSSMMIEGEFDLDAAQTAMNRVIARHQILRTVYLDKPEGPIQQVLNDFDFCLKRYDLTHLPYEEQQQKARELIEQDSRRLFDLSADLMVRAGYIRMSASDQEAQSALVHGILLFNMHHIASDGWSSSILATQFGEQYQSVLAGKQNTTAPLPIQYIDYAHWQRQWLSKDVLAKQLDYWQQYLMDAPMSHQLPMDRTKSDAPRTGGTVDSLISASLTTKIRQKLQSSQTTLFMLMQAAFAVHFGRLSSQQDIVLGAPTAGRVDKQLSSLIGLFLNTQLYRTRFDDNPDFDSLLARVREDHLAGAQYNEVPFEAIVDRINPQRSLQQSPLFQILLNLNNTANSQSQLDGLSVSTARNVGHASGSASEQDPGKKAENKYDLTVYIQENPQASREQIRFCWVYDARLFDHQTVQMFSNQFEHLLEQLITCSSTPVLKLGWHNVATSTSASAGQHSVVQMLNPVMDLLEAQVDSKPQAIALSYGSAIDGLTTDLSYRDLDQQVNQLANYLADNRQIKVGCRVAIACSRNANRIKSILAVLKLGGCYVPLSEELPQARIKYMLDNADVALVITDTKVLSRHDWLSGDAFNNSTLILDDQIIKTQLKAQSKNKPEIGQITADTPAHIIYTSGSSGRPKGVLGTYGATANRITWMHEQLPFEQDEAMVHITSMAFIRGVWELLVPLCGGCRLVLCARELVKQTDELWSLLIEQKITRMVTAPSLLKALTDIADDQLSIGDARQSLKLKHWFASGEPLLLAHAKALLAKLPGLNLYNLYGSTEVMSDVLWHQIKPDSQGLYAVAGKTISGVAVTVLDQHLQSVPEGVIGELVVSGRAVSSGYLGATEDQKSQFIDTPNGRAYRTGDLGRVLNDGTIQCLGRIDQQIKVRGYRIELGEIEMALSQIDSVQSAVVIAKAQADGFMLIAYVVLAPEHRSVNTDTNQLNVALAGQLPTYMLPAHYQLMTQIPLKANGKVDKGALPAIELTQKQQYIEPITSTEMKLAVIWQQLLELTSSVSRVAHFFELGGHSLLATRLVSAINQQFDCRVQVRAIFEHSLLQNLAEHIEQQPKVINSIVTPLAENEDKPLSFSQQRLWFIDKLEGGSSQYNMPVALKLQGKLNVEAMNKAVASIVQRHQILRTTYSEVNGQSVQQVQSEVDDIVTLIDLTHLESEEQAQQVKLLTQQEALKTFDLSQDLMLRVQLLQLGEQEQALLLTMHHIASDGWSLGVLVNEFMQLYDGFGKGLTDILPPLKLQYADYANWQREQLQGELLDSQLGYWQQHLGDIPQVHSLPLDKPRPAQQSFSGRLHHSQIDVSVTRSLEQLALSHDASLFMVLQSAFSLLIGRWSNEQDIVIGSPVAGRTHQDVEPLIGFFVNTLVLRTQWHPEQSFNRLLAQNKQHILDAYSHQHVPFEYLVEQLMPTRSLSYAPLAQIMFALHNIDNANQGVQDELSSQRISAEQVQFGVDLNLAVQSSRSGLKLTWTYATSLFEASTIARLADSFATLLTTIGHDSEQRLGQLPVVPDGELAQINQWSVANRPYEAQLCVHQLIERGAQAHPDKIAIVAAEDEISYEQLNAQANQLAGYLISKEIKPGDTVGLCVERCIEMIMGMVAIGKAGGVYVPLDPSLPEERIEALIQDSQIQLVLAQQAIMQYLPVLSTIKVMPLDESFRHLMLKSFTTDNLSIERLTSNDLACILYTSGSTGKPKGVMVEHKSLTRLVNNNHFVPLNAQTCMLQAASFAFDAASFEIWGALGNGGCLVLYPESVMDLTELNRIIVEHSVNTMWLTAGLFEQWSLDIPSQNSLKYILAGGDVLSPKAVQRTYDALTEVEVINGYGPTENTTFTCCFSVPRDWPPEVPIPLGSVINGSEVMVLNEQMMPVPIGVQGQLYACGDGVARGYLNQQQLSEQVFVSNPDDIDKRCYLTGDLVRWRDDGQLDFCGRKDHQVKIRGFRIELDEIKSCIQKQAGVVDALVITVEEVQQQQKQTRIVAYVVSADDSTVSSEVLRGILSDQLPGYMVPAAIVVLLEFPLTTNGKVDKKALPQAQFIQADTYLAPRNETESLLVDIWQQLLNVEKVGIEDNFFAIGGDSILSIQIVSRANQAGLPVSTRQLFECQTIAKLALVAGQSSQTDTPQQPCEGLLTLLPIQQQFFETGGVGLDHFNQSLLLQTPTDFCEALLHALVGALYQRHDSLRLSFAVVDANSDGVWQGEYKPLTEQMLNQSAVIETLPQDSTLHSDFISERCQYYQTSLDLVTGSLFRAVYFKADDAIDDSNDNASAGRLFIVVHHIVVDGVSWRILLADVEQVYRQFQSGSNILLAGKTSSSQQWGEAIQCYGQSAKVRQQLNYWCEQFSHELPLLPCDFNAKDGPTLASAARLNVLFDTEQTKALVSDCPSAYRTQINELLLAGVYLGIYRSFGVNGVRLSLEGHGREDLFDHLDTTQTVGWFTSIFPLTLFSQDIDVASVIKAVKEQCRALPENGIGYGALLQERQLKALAQTQPASILFNYLGQFDQSMSKQSQFFVAPESMGQTASPLRLRSHRLGLTGSIMGGKLQLVVDYSDLEYQASTIEAFGEAIKTGLTEVINHCIEIEQGAFTPSDFPLAAVSAQQLDQWQQQYPQLQRLYPATPMQQGMYFHAQLDNSAYVTQVYPTLRGQLDLHHFHQAWQQVTNHHDILRTAFVEGDSGLHQLVVAEAQLDWQVIDVRTLGADTQEQNIEQYRSEDQSRGFKLFSAPLHRVTIFRLSDDRHLMLWTFHHMLLDGWCVPLVYRDVMLAYQGSVKGDPGLNLEPPPLYQDYMSWLVARDIETAQKYWAQYLGEFSAPTPLMIDRLPVDKSVGVRQEQLSFSVEDSQLLENLARDHQTTINTLLQLAWGYVLHRYSGEEQVVFGSTISGRPAEVAGVDAMVGLFINTVPVKVDFANSDNLGQMLTQLHRSFVANQDQGFVALPVISRQTQVPAGIELFESLMVFENYPVDAAMDGVDTNEQTADTFTVERKQTQQQTNYKLTIIGTMSDCLQIKCDYLAEHFSGVTVERLLGHIQNVLLSMVNAKTISQLDYQPEGTSLDQCFGEDQSEQYQQRLDQLVTSYAVESPDSIALRQNEQKLSYQSLDARANQLARELAQKGVVDNDCVAICLGRGFNQIISLLAVLKLGCAYVPLDQDYPAQRIQFMIGDSGASLLITDCQTIEYIGQCSIPLLQLDSASIAQAIASQSIQTLDFKDKDNEHKAGERLAYIMYTSGSTGQPKGVMVAHKSIVRLVKNNHFAQLNSSTILIQCASFAFDAATFEIWGALANGGQLVLYPDKHLDLAALNDQLQQHQVNTMWLTAGLFEQWSRNIPLSTQQPHLPPLPHLRQILAGGDVIKPAAVQRTYAALKNVTVINGYGPTENTTFSCCYEIPRDFDFSQAIPLGRTINGTVVAVLDDAMRPVPEGVCGHLYVGGSGLALGYRNLEQLTEQSFVHQIDGLTCDVNRWYDSGDLVCHLGDGVFSFVGRADAQVKVRGFRIELGEVEYQLGDCEGVQSAHVTVVDNEIGQKQLVAYVEPSTLAASADANGFASQLKNQLSARLPVHMLPAAIVVIELWPLTANGKLDKHALPKVDWHQAQGQCVAAANDTERQLVEIWSGLLAIDAEQLSVQGNFFELGGDSIVSIQAVSRSAKVGLHFSVRDLFENPTIRQLAKCVKGGATVVAIQAPVVGEQTLLPIQQHFLADPAGADHFNQALMLQLPDNFEIAALRSICEHLYQRHDALRLTFVQSTEVPSQSAAWQGQYKPYSEQLVNDTIKVADLGRATSQKIEDYANTVQSSLDIQAGRLFAAAWIKTDDTSDYLLLVVHHLVVDGVSWRILLEDIQTLYQQYIEQQPLLLTAKTSSYQQWGEFLNDHSKSDAVQQQADYWLTELDKQSVDFAKVAPSKVLNAEHSDDNCVVGAKLALDESMTKLLLSQCNEVYRTQINELLLASVALGVNRFSGDCILRLDMESHGRQQLTDELDLSQTVGWFTSVYPLTLDLSSALNDTDVELADVICTVKEQYRQVPTGGIGFSLLKYVAKAQGFDSLPASEMVFNYLGQFDQTSQEQSEIAPASQSYGQCVASERGADYPLVLNGAVVAGKLAFTLSYQTQCYDKTQIECLMQHIQSALEQVINHCVQSRVGRFTPSDFPLAKVSDAQLRQWQQSNDIADLYPASGMQQGLLFHSLLERGSYVTQTVLTFEHLQADLFQQSWQQVINRHNIFRTSFVGLTEGNCHQLVSHQANMSWHIEDITELNQGQQTQWLERYRLADKTRGFTPDEAPLMRMSLIELGQHKQQLIWSHHHALLDGWCTSLVFGEVTECYRALLAGQTPILKNVPCYRGYAAWLSEQDNAKAQLFWQQQLADIEATTALPLVYPGNTNSGTKGTHRAGVKLTQAQSDSLVALAKSTHTTVNVLVQAAWAIVLHKYSGETQLVFGAITSGRPAQLSGVEQMIGLFINALPVVVNVDSQLSTVDWLQQLHRLLVERESYSHLSLFDIEQATTKTHNLFDSLLVFENYPVDETIGDQTQAAELNVVGVESFEGTNYGMCITASLTAVLAINIEAQHSLIAPTALAQVLDHLVKALNGLVAAANGTVADITLLSTPEVEHQLLTLNDTQTAFDKTLLVHQLFEAQVLAQPNGVAVIFEQQQLSYQQLNAEANRLAHRLRASGVGPDVLVGICLERSVKMVVAILAVLKAGGAYVPLDPQLPSARIEHMLNDTQLMHLIALKSFVDDLTLADDLQLFALDDALNDNELIAVLASQSSDNLTVLANQQANNLVYVIYTSGSTGQPKGVMVEHLALHNRVDWMQQTYQLKSRDRILQKTPFNFDVSVWEFFWTLGYGATLVVAKPMGHINPQYLNEIIAEHQVSLLHFVPSMLKVYLSIMADSSDAFAPSVRQVFCSGENLDGNTAAQLYKQAPLVKLDNLYGPTEAAIDVSFARFDHQVQSASVPIGKPINNIQLLVLDKHLNICPLGATGELYIGGTGLARGYLNRADLTAEKFVELTSAQASDSQGRKSRWYQSGDLVRLLDDGQLLYIGRVDSQVKIRGLRVELGEISTVLSQCPQVESTIVRAPVGADGVPSLVAYVLLEKPGKNETSQNETELVTELQRYLSAKLPQYMVPATFVMVEQWPLNANGKVDHKALPQPDQEVGATQYVAPDSVTETVLCEIWAQLVGRNVDSLSIEANFMDFGGHSLHAMQVVHKVKEQLACDITIADIFTYQTVSQLATLVDTLTTSTAALVPVEGFEGVEDEDDFEELEF